MISISPNTLFSHQLAAVYGEISSDPIDENNLPDPQTPYGASKWMVERILKGACRF